MEKINRALTWPLHSVCASRGIEQQAAADLPPHTLSRRSGHAIARLALAIAPHARCIWIACGPGRTGSAGFEAGAILHDRGKNVVLTWTGMPAESVDLVTHSGLPPVASEAHATADTASIIAADAPLHFDLVIDALLGPECEPNECSGAVSVRIAQWLMLMNNARAPRLSVDVPTGLNADTGATRSAASAPSLPQTHRNAPAAERHTLSLLTLKPGLFTAQGRDEAGQVWWDTLGIPNPDDLPTAWLLGADHLASIRRTGEHHATHKGIFGDVTVLGGQSGPTQYMTGAALLAARGALHAGAGRVFVALLGPAPDADIARQHAGIMATSHLNPRAHGVVTFDPCQPELMFCSLDAVDCQSQVVVCGCGGGSALRGVLPELIRNAPSLVLDADALNAIAEQSLLQDALSVRAARGWRTVLTPHPLEAARLLGTTVDAVQRDRFSAAQQLAEQFKAVIVLKGSGTVIACSGEIVCVNASGNALLATPGTGDVLAGMVGAMLARQMNAWEAAKAAVFQHGRMADEWELHHGKRPLTASALARGY